MFALRLAVLLSYLVGVHAVPIAHVYAHQAFEHGSVEATPHVGSACTQCCSHPVKASCHSKTGTSRIAATDNRVDIGEESASVSAPQDSKHRCDGHCQICQFAGSAFLLTTIPPLVDQRLVITESLRPISAPSPREILSIIPGARGPPCV